MVQNHSLTVFAKYLFCRDKNVSQNEAAIEAICSVCWGQQNVCVLLIWSYDRYLLLPLQCLPVSAQLWQNRCQCLHSFDRTVASVCTVLTEPLPVYAQFWQNRCRCMHSFDRTVAGVCTVLTEPLPVSAQFWQNRCRCLHSFDRTVRFLSWHRNCGSELLYPAPDFIEIRKLSVFPSSKFSLCYYNVFFKRLYV